MKLGNKLLELRKNSGFSQEKLAERLEISRQTISKWELNESSPDLMQAKNISKIFNISLDELVDNDVKDLLTQKISNTERLAGLTIKILKIFGIFALAALVIFAIYKFISTSTYAWFIGSTREYTCNIGEEKYNIEIESYSDDPHNIGYENYWQCQNCNLEQLKEIKDLINYDDLNETDMLIKAYFKSLGGTCQ